MYTLDRSGRPKLNGKFVKVDSLPTSKTFTQVGSGLTCVVVAKNMEERVALANAENPEDIQGYEEALSVARQAL